MSRFTGQVQPYIPSSAPLSYRLSEEVYALDGNCSCGVGDDFASNAKAMFAVPAIIGIAVYFIFLRK